MENSIKQARRYLATCPVAVSGEGGDGRTFLVAVTLRQKFHLPEEDAFVVIQDWNQRCLPPWNEHELLHKIRSAAPGVPSGGSMYDFKGARTFQGGRSSRSRKSVFHPMVLKRIAAKTESISDIHAYLKNVSPVAVDDLGSADVLRLLYPPGTDERILIFSVLKSQGQLVWNADDGEMIRDCDLPEGPEGVWFLPQSVSGLYLPNPRLGGKASRRSKEAVTAWRYVVLESDEAEPEDWLRCLVQLPLRITSVCESGGRSIHALVRIDAASKTDWDEKVASVKPLLVTLGADPGALTAIRLTRLPQALRGERVQRLLYLNPTPDTTPIMSRLGKIGQ